MTNKQRVALLFVLVIACTGCVSSARYRRDVLLHYKKGLKVGRVIGRDEVLFKLKDPSCFQQTVDDLMNPAPMDKE